MAHCSDTKNEALQCFRIIYFFLAAISSQFSPPSCAAQTKPVLLFQFQCSASVSGIHSSFRSIKIPPIFCIALIPHLPIILPCSHPLEVIISLLKHHLLACSSFVIKLYHTLCIRDKETENTLFWTWYRVRQKVDEEKLCKVAWITSWRILCSLLRIWIFII